MNDGCMARCLDPLKAPRPIRRNSAVRQLSRVDGHCNACCETLLTARPSVLRPSDARAARMAETVVGNQTAPKAPPSAGTLSPPARRPTSDPQRNPTSNRPAPAEAILSCVPDCDLGRSGDSSQASQPRRAAARRAFRVQSVLTLTLAPLIATGLPVKITSLLVE